MSKKLFVGCRVRILYSDGWPELAGQEGRITGETDPSSGPYPHGRWEVAPDAWGSDFAPYRGLQGAGRFAPRSSQIEPIAPSGHRSGDYSYTELMDRLKAGEGVPA